MTATLLNQNAKSAQSAGSFQHQPLRKLEDLLQDVSKLTGLPKRQVATQVKSLDFPTYEFEGMVLVSPDVTDPLIDHWSEQIKARLRTQSPDQADAPVEAAPPEAPAAKTAKVTPPEPASSAANTPDDADDEGGTSPSTSMRLPKGFSQVVSNRYGSTLEKLLPEDTEERQEYIQEIVRETERGKDFLMRIATAIQKKYKGRTGRGKAYKGLMDKAKAIWEGMVAADEIAETGSEAAEA
jgi:hypothetical protein